MPYPARYPAHIGYPRAVATTAMVPRGYVPGAGRYVSGGRALMPSSYNMVSVTRLSLLSFVWSPSCLPVSCRLSTCSGSYWTLTAVGWSDSLRTIPFSCLPGTCSHLPSPRLTLRLLYHELHSPPHTPPPSSNTTIASIRRVYQGLNKMVTEGYPKPRHNYTYTPRYGQRGVLTYAGQQANGAYPSGVAGRVMSGYGYGYGVGGVGYAGGAYPVYNTSTYSYPYSGASYYGSSYYPSYSTYGGLGGYYNYGLYGSMYPLANFYLPYQRSYYNTVPTYGQTAYVYPPGPTTTTTTYHVSTLR